jgi:hypothetical protein
MLAFVFRNFEPNLTSLGQLLEPSLYHAVSVKVDLLAVGGGDEAIAGSEDASDPPVERRAVRLDVAARPAGMVLKLALGRRECFTDRHVHVLVCLIPRAFVANHDFLARNRDRDVAGVQFPLRLMAMGCFNGYPAADDAIEKALQSVDAFTDLDLDSGGGIHVAKHDLKRDLHSGTSIMEFSVPRTFRTQGATAIVGSSRGGGNRAAIGFGCRCANAAAGCRSGSATRQTW